MKNRTSRRLAATLAAIASTALVGVGPAHASSEGPYTGKVTAHGGLVARRAPATSFARTGGFAQGARIRIICKVHGPAVRGNDLWYSVRGSRSRWVSARYVRNIGRAPRLCGDGQTSTGTVRVGTGTHLILRAGPSTRTARVGVRSKGDTLRVSCWWDGQRLGNTSQWYQLTNGAWVAAHLISPTSPRVEICA